MKVTKTIIDTLNISDPIAVYSDPDRYLMDLLRRRYERRCHSGCFITKVISIKRRGPCLIAQDGSPHMGTVDIEFIVSGVIYSAGDIIIGATVVKRDIPLKYILCKLDNEDESVTAYIKSERITDSIRERQKIIVYVVAAKYQLQAGTITVNGEIFTHKNTTSRTYSVADQLPTPEVLERMRAAEAEYAAQKQQTPKLWEFFAKYMYPYKAPFKTSAKTATIADIVKSPADYSLVTVEPGLDPGVVTISGANPCGDVSALVQSYTDTLENMVKLQRVYSDPKDNLNLWKIIEMSRI